MEKGSYKFLKTLENFPVRALPNTSQKSLHSPDLTKYFDPFDMTIKSMETEEVIANISDDIIQNQGWKKAVNMANTFKWINSDAFNVVSESGLERAFFLEKQELTKEEVEEGKPGHQIIEFGFTQVPYFKKEELTENHFYDEREPLSFMQTKERLQRKYLQYKRATLI